MNRATVKDKTIGRIRKTPRFGWLLFVLLLLAAIAVVEWILTLKSTPVWYSQAESQFAQGQVDQAIRQLDNGQSMNPRFAPAYELLSDCYIATRQTNEALLTLGRLRSLEPDRPHIVTRIAEAYLSGDSASLLRSAREAAVQEPRSPRARMLLAYALARSGRSTDALSEAVLADQLAASASVTQRLNRASGFKNSPTQLAQGLRELIFLVPYE